MKWKVIVCLFALSFLGAAARGQEFSRFDVFGGYSYVRANPSSASGLDSFSMNGGDLSLAYHATSWLSAVGDFGGYHATRPIPFACEAAGCANPNSQDFKGNTWTYLFGPRVNLPHIKRIRPFAQVLFGVAHTTPNVFLTNNQTDFAMTVGGGFDYRLSHRLSVRPLQVEYLQTRFNEVGVIGRPTQDNLRVSTGFVFRF